jgi:hypothetical protein
VPTKGYCWQCVIDRWTAQVLDASGVPIATIRTTIGDDASVGEVANSIKASYPMVRTPPQSG